MGNWQFLGRNLIYRLSRQFPNRCMVLMNLQLKIEIETVSVLPFPCSVLVVSFFSLYRSLPIFIFTIKPTDIGGFYSKIWIGSKDQIRNFYFSFSLFYRTIKFTLNLRRYTANFMHTVHKLTVYSTEKANNRAFLWTELWIGEANVWDVLFNWKFNWRQFHSTIYA